MHSRSEPADLVLIGHQVGGVGGFRLPSRSAGERCLVVRDLEIVLQHVPAAAREVEVNGRRVHSLSGSERWRQVDQIDDGLWAAGSSGVFGGWQQREPGPGIKW